LEVGIIFTSWEIGICDMFKAKSSSLDEKGFDFELKRFFIRSKKDIGV
jgi:hypothetical protein